MSKIKTSDSVLIVGSMFADKGGWSIDQQFMEQTGSTYLLAHGLGKPVADAQTHFEAPADGDYNLYVRTKCWTKLWSRATAPCTFRISIDGKADTSVFGAHDPEWHWERGTTIHLAKGTHTITVHDNEGFDARFDAILLTTLRPRLDASAAGITRLRHQLLGIPAKAEYKGKYDLVVVGGGVAGMCAAIAAARLGSRVALIQDRYVMGGNNSSEIRVGLGGRINIGMYPSLGYLLNEMGPATKGNARTPDIYEDDKKMNIITAEPRITLFTGYKASAVKMSSDSKRIREVVATQIEDYSQIRIAGTLFSDCTGDATLGVLAGAEWHMGREAQSTYGEPSAPAEADSMTMGASLQWYCLESDREQKFPDIKWGLRITPRSVQVVRRGQWYWEVGMRDDQIADAERIRDYGMYVAYSNWSYLKNRYSKRSDYSTSYLGWVSYVAGKRESRRLIGEFVLREQDLKNNVIYPDGSASTSWYIDQHYPDPENSKLFPNREYLSCGHLDPMGFYPIPYRCFYSKDVENMFMAGRNISVSHIALGTVRVMRTTAMMGEVVGMAADICRRRKSMPKAVYTQYLEQLKALMRKGVGKTDMPYLQVYTLIDTTAARSEEC